MEKAAALQQQIRLNSNDLSNYLADLGRWEKTVKKDDEELKKTRRIEEKLPPIRSRAKSAKEPKPLVAVEKQNVTSEETHPGNEKKAPIKSYDYDAWNKFDVDEACNEVDKEEQYTSSEDEDEDEDERERIDEERKVQYANMEKEKGNDFFKEGKYESAINRYTNAIGLHPTNAILYANRAMALFKVDRFGAAERDCTDALQRDPTYAKAFFRRANSRHKLKKFSEARSDYLRVLELEPKNKQAPIELKKIEQDEKAFNESTKKDSSISTNTNQRRKIRSKKPLKRVLIKEVGIADIVTPTMNGDGGKNSAVKIEEISDDVEMKEVETSRSSSGVAVSIETVINSAVVTPRVENNRVPPTPDVNVCEVTLEIPSTSFKFETEFRRLQIDREKLYTYIKMIPTKSYSKLFCQCIDKLLSPFINCLLNCYTRDGISIHLELLALSRVPRFEMAIMFLSNADKQVLIGLLKTMNSSKYPTAIEPRLIADIAAKYGMKL